MFKRNQLQTNNRMLKENFSSEEIREVMWNSKGDISPTPDGYNLDLIKKCWDIVGDEVVQFFLYFHSKAFLSRAMSASFIALISKVDCPLKMEDYRPICLIGAVYKIISKLLAARLAKVIDKLISKTQTTFIPGRQVLDGILVTNEIIDFAKRKKKECLLLKVDFS